MLKRCRRVMVTLFCVLLAPMALAASSVNLHTSLGNIVIELDTEKAPISSANFLHYVNSGFYDGLVFHRVIPNFMIQGGGLNANLELMQTSAPIKNEADNGLRNKRGTVAMARTRAVDSATSQFFINVIDNDRLNHRSDKESEYGYAVFGRVVVGMDIVDKIANTKTHTVKPHRNVPVTPLYIIKATAMD